MIPAEFWCIKLHIFLIFKIKSGICEVVLRYRKKSNTNTLKKLVYKSLYIEC